MIRAKEREESAMLLEFTVENFLSFKDKTVLSMIASKNKEKEEEQTVPLKKLRILKNAAIYGANASGKSNLLVAINFMHHFVINSSKDSQQGDTISVSSFKFNTESEKKPSVFEMVFLCDDIVYRYGFEVTPKKVESEWLFARYTAKETQLFVRNEQNFQVGVKFKEGKKYIEAVRKNTLFLSVCAQFNGIISSKILHWFRQVHVISSLEERGYKGITLHILENKSSQLDKQKRDLIAFIKGIDVGIQNIALKNKETIDFDNFLENLSPKDAKHLKQDLMNQIKKDGTKHKGPMQVAQLEILSTHNKYDKNKKLISSDDYDFGIESTGTQKIFDLAGPIIDTLYHGGILCIDEIQNSLHTSLVIGLIKYFVTNKINMKAQFIFTTHDVNILAADILRRDEFWFVEKNNYGESDLTCLVDFDEHVRKDARLDKDYLRGRYGAIPFLTLENLHGNR